MIFFHLSVSLTKHDSFTTTMAVYETFMKEKARVVFDQTQTLDFAPKTNIFIYV